MNQLPEGRLMRSAVLSIEIFDPTIPPGRRYALKRMVPIEHILENSTENYNSLTLELGDMIRLISKKVKLDDHSG